MLGNLSPGGPQKGVAIRDVLLRPLGSAPDSKSGLVAKHHMGYTVS